jgi:hypothetical protein
MSLQSNSGIVVARNDDHLLSDYYRILIQDCPSISFGIIQAKQVKLPTLGARRSNENPAPKIILFHLNEKLPLL